MPQALDGRSAEEIAESHPLLEWYGRMAARGVSVHGLDIVLEPSLASRFAIGVEPDGEVSLGVLVEDAPHILSINWVKADMVRRFKGRDWLVLTGRSGDSPDMRLFIPMADVVSTIFEGHAAQMLRIRRAKMIKGRVAGAKEPQAEISLSMKGY